MLADLKKVKCKSLEDMVYRMELTYDEIVDILDVKYIGGSTIGKTTALGISEISDSNLILKSSRPKGVKVKNTIDDIRLKSNLTTYKTIKFTNKSFFYTILGFMESHSGALGDISGFVQLIPGSYKSDKPLNNTGIDKIHIKADFNNGIIANGIREPIVYCFHLDQPPGYKIFSIKFFKKVNKSLLSRQSLLRRR